MKREGENRKYFWRETDQHQRKISYLMIVKLMDSGR